MAKIGCDQKMFQTAKEGQGYPGEGAWGYGESAKIDEEQKMIPKAKKGRGYH